MRMMQRLSVFVVCVVMLFGAYAVVPGSAGLIGEAKAHDPTYCGHGDVWKWHFGHWTKARFLYHFDHSYWHYHAVWYEHGWWWDGSRTNICGPW